MVDFDIKHYLEPEEDIDIDKRTQELREQFYGDMSEKPETEQELFALQEQYLKTRDHKIWVKMFEVTFPYIKSLILKKKKEEERSKWEESDEIAAKASTATFLFLSQYLKKPQFEVGASFADGIVNIIDNIYGLPVTSIRADAFNGQEISCILVPELRYDSIHSNAGGYADKVFVNRGKVNIVDGDNTTLSSSDQTCYLPGDITYRRTFSEAGQYATMCLPFDLPVTNAQEAFEQVYVAQGNIIHNTSTGMYILMLLNPEGESIPAGTPFFVKTKDTDVTLQNNVLCSMTTTPATTPLTVVDWDGKSGLMTQCPDVNVTCSGTLAARTDFDATYYTFNTDGSFGNQRTDANFPAYRMYLNITNKSNQAAPILMSIGIFDDDDNTTGILNVMPVVLKKSVAEGTFTIDGRAVKGALSRGLYIVNGKKVVVE